MSLVGMSYEEATHLVAKQGAITDALRGQVRAVDSHIASLGSTYVSATITALRAKWESDTKPQLEKIIARSEAAQEGTRNAVSIQRSQQDDAAGQINAV